MWQHNARHIITKYDSYHVIADIERELGADELEPSMRSRVLVPIEGLCFMRATRRC